MRPAASGSSRQAHEVLQHVGERDRLRARAHPARRHHAGQVEHEVADHFERRGPRTDDHAGAQFGHGHRAFAQQVARFAARGQVRRRALRGLQSAEVHDALHARARGGVAEVHGGLAVDARKVRAGRHRMDEVIGDVDACQRAVEARRVERVGRDDFDAGPAARFERRAPARRGAHRHAPRGEMGHEVRADVAARARSRAREAEARDRGWSRQGAFRSCGPADAGRPRFTAAQVSSLMDNALAQPRQFRVGIRRVLPATKPFPLRSTVSASTAARGHSARITTRSSSKGPAWPSATTSPTCRTCAGSSGGADAYARPRKLGDERGQRKPDRRECVTRRHERGLIADPVECVVGAQRKFVPLAVAANLERIGARARRAEILRRRAHRREAPTVRQGHFAGKRCVGRDRLAQRAARAPAHHAIVDGRPARDRVRRVEPEELADHRSSGSRPPRTRLRPPPAAPGSARSPRAR